MTHICVGKLTIICSVNGLSPGRRQAIIWTNTGLLLIRHLETNFSEILIGIQTFSFKKMHLKMSSAKWRPFCIGLNVLTHFPLNKMVASLTDNIFKCIFLNENHIIPIQISLKFIPRSPIDNKPALVQVMAWRRTLRHRNNGDLVHWRIYAALGGDELMEMYADIWYFAVDNCV